MDANIRGGRVLDGHGLIPDDEVALAVEVFRMLANETRVQLLWAVRERERSVTELAAHLEKPVPAVSQHLAKLRMARLVSSRRQGQQIYYLIENEHVARLVTDAVHNAEHAGPNPPAHHDEGMVSLRSVGGHT
ncbi:MAG: metalloregulator ArsR/SmtB family transcription factor [bacterium]|nr:metalloregulator ArsR/SmtB family transcription factor [bacterium]